MFKVRYQNQKILISEYKPEMKGEIYCESCGVPVVYTSAHIRKLREHEVKISAYFRLKSEKKYPHTDECDYVVENSVKKIYAGCANDTDLMTKDNGRFIVRLHIITDRIKYFPKSSENHEGQEIRNKPKQQFIKTGDKPAYINTIRRILKLRDQVEHEKDLADILFLSFYNLKTQQYDNIKWKNFFIENDKTAYIHLYQYLQKRRYHPICFCGTVKEVVTPTEKFPYYKFKCYSIMTNENQYTSFEVLFNNVAIYEDYKDLIIQKNIIVYGSEHYAAQPHKVENKINKNHQTEFLNINTKIYGSNQIMILE